MKKYIKYITIISVIYSVVKMLFFTPDILAKVQMLQQYQALYKLENKIGKPLNIDILDEYYKSTPIDQLKNAFILQLSKPFDRGVGFALSISRTENAISGSGRFIDVQTDMLNRWNGVLHSVSVLPQMHPKDHKSVSAILANGIYAFAESLCIGGLTGGLGTVIALGMDFYSQAKVNKVVKYVLDSNDFDLSEYGN